MKAMAVSEFRSHALRIIDQVARNHESFVLTKRGKSMEDAVLMSEDRKLHTYPHIRSAW